VTLSGGDPASLATLEQVRAWSAETAAGGPIRILDVRKPAEFIGEDLQSRRGGRVPGAVNVDWERFVHDGDNTFRTPAAIRAIVDEAVRAAGGTDASTLRAAYCQGGVRAAAAWFVLSVLGGLPVANYARSWEEWGNRDDTPIEV
jgi:thiosulfate/3-mercaptopyruvate sulfurtransferase